MLPVVGQKRKLKMADGSRHTIMIAQVNPSECGHRAFDVWDTKDRMWVFAMPYKALCITSPEVSCEETKVCI
jgi:hypothetical protein